MFKAIETKWLAPTNTRGSRIKATARKREADMPEMAITDNWDHGSAPEGNHCRVAQLMAAKLEWTGIWVGGATADGYAFVLLGGYGSNQWAMYCDDDSGETPEPIRGEGTDWFRIYPAHAIKA